MGHDTTRTFAKIEHVNMACAMQMIGLKLTGGFGPSWQPFDFGSWIEMPEEVVGGQEKNSVDAT